MARTRGIQKRLAAVRSIRTVTGTMEMVAAVRFRRLHPRVVAVGAYADHLESALARTVAACGCSHPLLKPSESNKRVLLVLTSDRGLCGAFNTAVLTMAARRLVELQKTGQPVELRVVGRHGVQFFAQHGASVSAVYEAPAARGAGHGPGLDEVARLANSLMYEFLEGRFGSLDVAYVRFVSAGRQTPSIATILPFAESISPEKSAPPSDDVAGRSADEVDETVAPPDDLDFMPDSMELLERLLPGAVRTRLYRYFLDSAISEQAMRMTAMRAANDNADDMIRDLAKSYNRIRQSQITTELAEIMGGSQRIADVGDVTDELRKRLRAEKGKFEVVVRTSVPLNEAHRSEVKKLAAALVGQGASVVEQVVPSLVGGLMLVAGDAVFDASVASEFAKLRAKAS